MDEKEDSKFEPISLSFEEEDKLQSSESLPSITNNENIKETNENNLLKKKTKKKKTIDINKQKLTFNSKINIFISGILVSISLLFIPFHSVANSYLITIEKNKLFNSVEKLASFETLNSSSLKKLFSFFNIFLNKDFMSGFLCLLYIVFHPFIAMKIIFGANVSFYCVILMQILYKSRRPSWEEWATNNKDKTNPDIIIECEASFSSPSSSLFIFTFYTIYSLYAYRKFYFVSNQHMNMILKVVLFVIFMSFMITEYIFLLMYKMHYLHEMIFTTCLALIYICLLIGFDHKLQNMLYRATKNLFKIRKNKIKYFLYCFLQLLFAILLFNFTAPKITYYRIEEKILASGSCSKFQKEEISLENTFIDISYIFCLLGTFWGAALTLEHPPGEWWYHPEKIYYSEMDRNTMQKESNKIDKYSILFLFLKGLTTLLVFLIIWFIFRFIPYISFIFNFVMNCIKYFVLFFICTGILPIMFGIFGLNKDKKTLKKRIEEFEENKVKIEVNKSNLFKSSLFVQYFDRDRMPVIARNKQIPFLQSFSSKGLINPSEEDSYESL